MKSSVRWSANSACVAGKCTATRSRPAHSIGAPRNGGSRSWKQSPPTMRNWPRRKGRGVVELFENLVGGANRAGPRESLKKSSGPKSQDGSKNMGKKASLNGVPPTPIPPPNLGPAGIKLWADIHASYEINDPPALQLLAQCCAASDRAARAGEQINREGETFTTASGMVRPHPLLAVELSNRQFVSAALKRLGLI